MSSNRHSWISSAVLYSALLTLPILLYIFLYQGSRIDDATMRNFRSLGTAADRIGKALDTFKNVSKNYTLGVDSTLLNEVTRACQKLAPTPGKLRDIVALTRKESKLDLKTSALIREPSSVNGSLLPSSSLPPSSPSSFVGGGCVLTALARQDIVLLSSYWAARCTVTRSRWRMAADSRCNAFVW